MKNKPSYSLVFISFLMLSSIFISCSHSKMISEDTNKENFVDTKTISPKTIYKSLINNEFLCENMKCHFDAVIFNSSSEQSVKGIIQYKNTHEFLINATFMSINVLTAYIHNDSVLIINKLKKIYIHEPLFFLSTIYGFEIDTEALEDIIFGRIIDSFYDNLVSSTVNHNIITLCLNNNDPTYYVTSNTPVKSISSSLITSQIKNQTVEIKYPSFFTHSDGQMPSEFTLSINEPQINAKLTLSRIEIDCNDFDINVKIPSNYERAKW